MNDGLDTPDTIAFGLGAAETAALVLSLLVAYAVSRSGLPGALAWTLAGLVAGTGAALGWVRIAERSLLCWSVLLGAHGLRRRGEVAAAARQLARRTLGVVTAAVRTTHSGTRQRAGWATTLAWRFWTAARGAPRRALPRAVARNAGVDGGAICLVQPGSSAGGREPACPIPIGGREHSSDAGYARGPARSAWLLAFTSLSGGSGRTTIACEVAALLAARGHARGPGGRRRPLRVTLVDLCGHHPMAAPRLGLQPPLPDPDERGGGRQPSATAWSTSVHESGVELVWLAAVAAEGAAGAAASEAATVTGLVGGIEAAGADVVVLDMPCMLDAACRAVLGACDQIGVVMTPTPGGVLDGYRSTALLRRLGLRERLVHIVNKSTSSFDTTELVGDLSISALVHVPEDRALVEAEGGHTICALHAGGPAAMALCELAASINRRLLGIVAPLESARAWGGHAG